MVVPVRVEGVLVEVAGDERIAYVRSTDTAHALNAAAGALFEAIDGSRSVEELAGVLDVDVEVVRLGVRELVDAGLVTVEGEPSVSASRRDLLKKLGVGSMAAAALPVVETIVAPSALAAQSVVPPTQAPTDFPTPSPPTPSPPTPSPPTPAPTPGTPAPTPGTQPPTPAPTPGPPSPSPGTPAPTPAPTPGTQPPTPAPTPALTPAPTDNGDCQCEMSVIDQEGGVIVNVVASPPGCLNQYQGNLALSINRGLGSTIPVSLNAAGNITEFVGGIVDRVDLVVFGEFFLCQWARDDGGGGPQ